MQFETYTYTIGAHFLPALINADESGLDDHESALLAAFVNGLPATDGHWSCDADDGPDFARCDVTDLMSGCVVCQYFAPVVSDESRSYGPRY